MTNSELVANYMKLNITARAHEVFIVMFLDNQHQLIETQEMFRDTTKQAKRTPKRKKPLYFHAYPCCVGDMDYQRSSQKAFIDAVWETADVSYCHPCVFRSGAREVTIPKKTLTKFLCRLSPALNFDAYDRLTRAVWLAHFRTNSPYG